MIALLIAFKNSRLQSVYFISWLLPVLVIGGTWFVFLNQYGGPSLFISGIQNFLQALQQGQYPWEAMGKILRSLLRHTITINVWGLLFPAAIVLVILNRRRLSPKHFPLVFALLAPVLATSIGILFFYVFVSFIGELDMWMSTGLDRMFLPFIVLSASWIILLVGSPNLHTSEKALPSR
jgi:hypothetical protein